MEKIRENMLQTSILDKEITSNQGKQFFIIESLRKRLEQMDPILFAQYSSA